MRKQENLYSETREARRLSWGPGFEDSQAFSLASRTISRFCLLVNREFCHSYTSVQTTEENTDLWETAFSESTTTRHSKTF